MISGDIRTEHPLTLRRAIDFYPQATWSTNAQGRDRWTSSEVITGAPFAPVFDLDQPVLFIDRAIYPAVSRKQQDVLPRLILMNEIPDESNLESFLVDSCCPWLDLNGVCWHPDELRQRLTLEQRATEIYAIEQVQGDSMETGYEVVVAHTEAILFVLVNSLADAQDAYCAFARLGMDAIVAVARTIQHGCGRQRAKALATPDLVLASLPTHDLDLVTIERMVPPSQRVRMADRDDIPCWPLRIA